jgi:LuxR family maltose regulon positive regulatory protein
MPAPDNAGPLLETKLYVPRVARPRLSERLSRGAEHKLTLVSAPAGFGKTTLLAEWLASIADDAPSPAWLSLDPSDSEATTFWSGGPPVLSRKASRSSRRQGRGA